MLSLGGSKVSKTAIVFVEVSFLDLLRQLFLALPGTFRRSELLPMSVKRIPHGLYYGFRSATDGS
jgi:hypothetical protein